MANLTFSYTANTPEGNQQINQTQAPIVNNFMDISQWVAVDHSPFQTASVPNAAAGIHNKVTFFQQTADPTPVPNAINLYSKPVTTGNGYELFYQYPSGVVQQLTGQNTGSGTGTGGGAVFDPSASWQGYQYISGGILMKWGTVIFTAFTATASYTLPFSTYTPLPAFSATPFHMEWMIEGTSNVGFQPPGGITSVRGASATTMQVQASIPSNRNNTTVILFWMAIGV